MSARKQHDLDVRFDMPAFLHGASGQRAEWRVPPFRAALREWWRVAWAADQRRQQRRADTHALWAAEAELFGATHGTARQSRVRLRLLSADPPRADWTWPVRAFRRVDEQKQRAPRADVYLGYGPVSHRQDVQPEAVLPPGSGARLRLQMTGVTASQQRQLAAALLLLEMYGTLGARSRNGWGSLRVRAIDGASLSAFGQANEGLDELLGAALVPRDEALDPEQGCIWSTGCAGEWARSVASADWPAAVNELGRLLYRLRRAVAEEAAKKGVSKEIAWIWLGVPVSSARNVRWGKARWASQLRFKVRRSGKKTALFVSHWPALPPEPLLAEIAKSLSASGTRVGEEQLRTQLLRVSGDVWNRVERELEQWQQGA